MKEHSEPSKEERKRLLIEMMKEDEKSGMYETDLPVNEWLKTVTPEMYQAVSAIREVLRNHDGTKAKMLIAQVIEQYVASQFKQPHATFWKETARLMDEYRKEGKEERAQGIVDCRILFHRLYP